MEADECQCEKCREWRDGQQVEEPEDFDLDVELDGEGDDEMDDDLEPGVVRISEAAEDQAELPQVLYVEMEVTDDDLDMFVAHTAIDTIENEKQVGIYRLVDVKTVKKVVELV